MNDILDELFPKDKPLPPRNVVHRQYEFEGEYGERGELRPVSEMDITRGFEPRDAGSTPARGTN